MRHLKLILILAVLLIAAVMQWQGVRIRAREAELRQEVAALEMPETQRHTTPSPSNAAPQRTTRSSRSKDVTARSTNVDASGKPQTEFDHLTRAIENGDLVEATRNFCLIRKEDPKRVALNRLLKAVTTPEDQLDVLEQAGKSADQPTFLQLGQALARKSTFEANLDLLSRADLTPEKRDLAAATIAGASIDDDTPARATWLLKSLQTDQTAPVTHFTNAWTEGDFRAVTTWVNTLPPGRARDAAVVGFAPAAARIDGASAVDWALTITDPSQRKSTLDTVFQTWRNRQPDAAPAYLREKGIETEGTR